MKIKNILIRNNETGEVRKGNWYEGYEWQDWLEYMIEKGNYGCDCNRSILWHSAIDPAWDGESDECGDKKYSIRIIGDDDSIIYDEFV